MEIILLILQQTIEIDIMQTQKMVVSAAAIYRNGLVEVTNRIVATCSSY